VVNDPSHAECRLQLDESTPGFGHGFVATPASHRRCAAVTNLDAGQAALSFIAAFHCQQQVTGFACIQASNSTLSRCAKTFAGTLKPMQENGTINLGCVS